MQVALAHDYLTQRGGAERVVLALLKAFPGSPLYTSLYDPSATFPQFQDVDVRTLALDRVPLLRRHHRLALPLLAPAFDRLEIDADVLVCSSSGWAHGAHTRGRKIVYCYTPARWLYQSERYVGEGRSIGGAAIRVLRARLETWDMRAAASADRYIAISTEVRERIRTLYGRDAEILPPPHTIDPAGPRASSGSLGHGFLLCVSRLLPYKNVAAVVDALALLPEERLIVAGDGPERTALEHRATANVRFLGAVTDEVLRTLYDKCFALLTASYEDFGLTPLEAAAFGKPTAALRWGGFLDTLVEGTTGVFFDEPKADAIAAAVRRLRRERLPAEPIRAHADRFSEDVFVRRIRELVKSLVA